MTVNDSDRELTPKQDRLIAALLAGNSIVAAAKVAGVGEKTAHVWLKLPHFQAAYKAAQKNLFDDRLSELRDGVGAALSTIKRTMTSEDALPATQLRAAQIWLEQAIAIYKTQELETKLERLEQLIKAQQAGSR